MGRRLALVAAVPAVLLLGWSVAVHAATTLYLRDAETNGLTFTDSGTFNYKDAATSAGSTAATAVTSTVTSGSQVRLTKTAGGLRVRWVSCPLDPVSIPKDSTFAFTVYGFESDLLANATWYTSVSRRIASSGASLVMATNQPFATELGTSNAALTFTATATATSGFTLLTHDRLIIDLRLNNAGGTMAGGHTVTMTYDHNVASGAETKVESSVTLSCFVAATPTPTKTTTPSPTATFTPGGGAPTTSPTPTRTATPTTTATPTVGIPQGDLEPWRLRAPVAGALQGQVPAYDETIGGHFRWVDRLAAPTPTSVTPTATPTVTRTATPTATPTPTTTATRTPVGCATPGNAMYGLDADLGPLCTACTGDSAAIVIIGSSYVWQSGELLFYTGS